MMPDQGSGIIAFTSGQRAFGSANDAGSIGWRAKGGCHSPADDDVRAGMIDSGQVE